MDKISYGEKAKALFEDGYNCAQSVALAFSDLYPQKISEDTLAALASGFGGGMARMREVCGAVSGMFMAADLLWGPVDKGHDNKAEHYALLQRLAEEYRQENGSIICRELLGLAKRGADEPTPEKRTEEYYHRRPCGEYCKIAAEILEREIERRNGDV